MKNTKGFMLFFVLIMIQIFSLLSITEFVKVAHFYKMNQLEWEREQGMSIKPKSTIPLKSSRTYGA
ncbi:MAG TPA: hypothetical protein VNC84_03225 [Gammaproteobacteria bacterium]|nr:hypothetical protein [Gammaproteobacteria bacterium]